MKFGVRKPSLKKSIKARTTGRAKRALKKSVNPLYGKKGMGWINNPRKAAYNKVYNKTTVPVKKLVSSPKKQKKASNSEDVKGKGISCGCLIIILIFFVILALL